MLEEELGHIPDDGSPTQALFRAIYRDLRKRDLERDQKTPRAESLHGAVLAVHTMRGHRRRVTLAYDEEYFASYARRDGWQEMRFGG
jgi:hypothetical protein